MGTTVDKLNKLKTTKEAIRTAINNKGGTLTTTDKFSDYATAINNIQSGSTNESITITENGIFTAPEGVGYSPITVNVPQTAKSETVKNLLDATKSAMYLFSNYSGTSINGLISYNDTSKVTNMERMFSNCESLTTIPQLDTSKVIYMSYMFYYCSSLTTIPQIDTSSATNIVNMFDNCTLLTTIDLTYMKPANIYSSSHFAYNCYSLTKLIIRNMDTIPTLNSSAFTNCYHFYGTINEIYNPEGLKDGRIYVPDDKVEELKAATNWSVFADIIVPLSSLPKE